MRGVALDRRAFLEAAGAAAFGAACAALAPTDAPRIGRVTIDGWVAHKRRTGNELRVIVAATGEDITNDCRYADDRGDGRAVVYLRDAQGRHYVGADGKAARALVRGVRIEERRA